MLTVVAVGSLTTLSVVVSRSTSRERSLDVVGGVGVVVASTALVVPTAAHLAAMPGLSTNGLAAALVVTPRLDAESVVAVTVRFVGATRLGGPLCVAAGVLSRRAENGVGGAW
jgi:hypothetical protein